MAPTLHEIEQTGQMAKVESLDFPLFLLVLVRAVKHQRLMLQLLILLCPLPV